MIDFFVSYAEADRDWAEWIGWQLEEAGYTVRLRAWDHELAGGNRVLAEDQDLSVAERLVAVLSPSYRLSPETRAHWSAFLRDDPAGEQRRIIPVEVAAAESGALLGNLSSVSLVGLDRTAARRAVLGAVRETRLKPSRTPGYPGRKAPGFPDRMTGGRGLARDTKGLIFLLGVDAVFFVAGAASYTGQSVNSGDLWRALAMIALFLVTLRSSGRWLRRRF
ncbi:toll/interleukin-1 receptor domain-containing protein [Streptomyces cinnamoneus]